MSLVLIVNERDRAVITSDGRLCRVHVNGIYEPLDEHSPKFVVLDQTSVIAATGKTSIADLAIQLVADWASALAPSGRCISDECDAFFAMATEAAQTALASCDRGSPFRRALVCALAYDGRAGRVRRLSLGADDEMRPVETTPDPDVWDVGVMGPPGDSSCEEVSDALGRWLVSRRDHSDTAIIQRMGQLTEYVASRHPSVNTVIFSHVIRSPAAAARREGIESR